MSLMTLAIPIFFVSLVAYVSMPLFSERLPARVPAGGKAAEAAREAERKRESLLKELKDMEMDLLMGKLSREDFDALRRTYEDDLIILLKKRG